MADELLLALHQLIKVAVKGVLGDVGVNVHLWIFVALPDDTALPLLEVGRTDFADNLSAMQRFAFSPTCAVCFQRLADYGFSWRRAYNTLLPRNRG